LIGATNNTSIFFKVWGWWTIYYLTVITVPKLSYWAFRISAYRANFTQTKWTLTLIVKRVVNSTRLTNRDRITFYISSKGALRASTCVNKLIPYTSICTSYLKRDTWLISKYFIIWALAWFQRLIPNLTRLTWVSNTKITIPDWTNWTFTTPWILNPLFSTCT